MAKANPKRSSVRPRIAALERRLKHLENAEAVRSVLARYCQALDTGDLEALTGLLAANAKLKVVPWDVQLEGRDTIAEFYRQFFAGEMKNGRHYCANISIEAEEDNYRSFCYFHETVERNHQSLIGWGTYEDVFTQEAGEWRFQQRLISILALTPIDQGWAGLDKIIS